MYGIQQKLTKQSTLYDTVQFNLVRLLSNATKISLKRQGVWWTFTLQTFRASMYFPSTFPLLGDAIMKC